MVNDILMELSNGILMEFSINSIKIPLKCHLPIKIPDNRIECSFIPLKLRVTYTAFITAFKSSGVSSV